MYGYARPSGSQIFETNIRILEQARVRRALALLTAVGSIAIGAAAITLAFEGMSTIPMLCLAVSLPTFAWGVRFAMRRPVTYPQSLAWVLYCDAAITIGLLVVTSSGVAFVKMAWLVAVSGYVFLVHGRRAMQFQSMVLTAGFVVTVGGAVPRGDMSYPELVIAVVTIALAAVTAGWVVYTGKRQLTRYIATRDHLVRHDPLTGVLNRRGLQEACAAWPRSTENKIVVAVVIDLDEFKAINDTYGHHIGDEVLRRTAQRLFTVAGLDTLLARLGGDEFAFVAIVYPPVHLGIPRMVSEALAMNDDFPTVTSSMGGAWIPMPPTITAHSPTLETVVHHLLITADAEMYKAKQRAAQDRATAGRHSVDRQRATP
ncbi:GGDEF domain-containing protein [Mycobacteroides sp. LB1]|nr:GGDEF domain-containing protein [Mycobacteroides sp. LB1]